MYICIKHAENQQQLQIPDIRETVWGSSAQLALTETVAQWECDQRPKISNISRGIFSPHSAAAVIGAIEKPSATAPARQGNAINIGLRNTF